MPIISEKDLHKLVEESEQTRPAPPKSVLDKLPFQFEDAQIVMMMKAASASFDLEKFDRAIDIYKGVEIIRPEWAAPTIGIGMAEYMKGEIDTAEQAYRAALKKERDSQAANVYLGELLWHARKDRAQATRYLHDAQKIATGSPLGMRATLVLKEIMQTPSTDS